jgi:MFS family permease
MKTSPVRDAAVTTDERINRTRRAAFSGWVGSALEYYDFALYAQAAALAFPVIFFPTGNAAVAVIASLATYAVGYVARPIGAIVLGGLGDRRGRKHVLVLAMLLMGVSTFAVGLLPTYQQVGILAPILLVLLRLVQGFAVAGELGGASAIIVEHAPDARRGFFASFSLQGSQVGSVLATLVMLPLATFLDDEAFGAWGWRVPFLLSAVVVLAGYLIRRHVEEPPAYLEQSDGAPERPLPIIELLRRFPTVIIRCVVITFANAIGMVTLTFGVTFATQESYGIGFSTSEFLWVILIANLVAVATIPLFGALSDRIGRKALMVGGTLAGGLLTGGYLWAIQIHSLPLVIVMVILTHSICYQMWNATFATFYQEQFPTRVRVSGFAVSQNIGLMLAAFFPSIFAAIQPPGSDGVPFVIGSVAFGICVVAAIATLMSRGTRGTTLQDIERL